jgi:hypothetical protein
MTITEDILSQGFTEITYRKDLSNYLINTKGEIFSTKTDRILKGTIDTNGYKAYTLHGDKGKNIKVLAHIAVARQFIPNGNPKRKTIVNHIDEDKTNPDVSNLEWTTPKENSNHGTCRKRGGDKRKKPVAEYNFNGELIRVWASVRDIVRFYSDLWDCDISKMTSIEVSIYNSCKYDNASSHGRIWRYVEGTPPRNIYVPKKVIRHADCSRSKLKLDYGHKVPDEYLYHKLTKDEIVEYFMSHDRLTENEKEMIKSLVGKR